MVDVERLADSAKDAIDDIVKYALALENALKSIDDLTREMTEDNWREISDKICNIAYENHA